MQHIWKIVLIVAAVIGLAFLLGWVGLKWDEFFLPRHADVKREAFEETKSYVHGGIQDLARYKEQYDKATEEIERQAIKNLVRDQFAAFDETNIKSVGLKNFLTEMRGY